MLWLIAIAISLDSLLVAFTYGLRGLLLPWKEIIKISLTVAVIFAIAMSCGQLITLIISVRSTEMLGGIILAVVGVCLLLSCFREQLKKPSNNRLSFLFYILKKPMSADLDRSGNINGMEGFWIGVALSLDSFGAGIGVSMMGASFITTPIMIFAITYFFLFLGVCIGKYCAHIPFVQKFSFLPGLLLISIGIWKVMMA